MADPSPTENGRRRVVIEGVSPEIDCGRFPIKRVVGEEVEVEADVFVDGHDLVAGVLRHRGPRERTWSEVPLEAIVNDRWRASFPVLGLGRYRYTLEAWVDEFGGWRRDIAKKIDAGQDVEVDLVAGAQMVEAAGERARARPRERLLRLAKGLGEGDVEARSRAARDQRLADLMAAHPDRSNSTAYGRELEVVVEPVCARTSAWYELFPRSLGRDGSHGTLADVERHLPYVAELGFDVLYLPPIHPIGRSHRKGRNNTEGAEPGDPGSPWAIGAKEGGHDAVHPELGSEEDVRRLVVHAREHGIELALDIAFQCAPDHPYVGEHPEWFRTRPDGTIQYAENPPKKYQDIYPLNFESEDWQGLWRELRRVVLHWIEQGVRIFRVDNPHTKPFAFWEWLITTVKADHPDVVFLSEAFTRPRVLERLAKLGFSQSYNYFAWRNTRHEIEEYFTELTQTEVREYLRPNLWPNTPDILTDYVATGGRPASIARLVLAATLGASYGIYGPVYELVETRPRAGEYMDSEKYEIRRWDLDQPHSLRELMARVNRIRRQNPALHTNRTLRFHGTDNDQLVCYSKTSDDGGNVILCVVNVDPHHLQAGWTALDLEALGLDPDAGFQVHDLLAEGRFPWHSPHNYVELNPHVVPAHVFRVTQNVRSERDFDLYQ
jgi:starch synthase (maltosyl-transferring)